MGHTCNVTFNMQDKYDESFQVVSITIENRLSDY